MFINYGDTHRKVYTTMKKLLGSVFCIGILLMLMGCAKVINTTTENVTATIVTTDGYNKQNLEK